MTLKNYDEWYQGWFRDNVKAPYLRDAWDAATKAAEEKFTSTNTGSPKLLNSLRSALPLVKNGMSSEEISNVRGVIADAIDQLRAGA